MTFNQIRYFVEVANCLNFTEAANRLYVSQQAVSTQIGNLEKEIGVHLFLRTTKKVALTESGKILYEEWQDMLKRTDLALVKAVEAGTKVRMKVRIGIAEMSGIIDTISIALAKYSEISPDVEVECEILPFKRLEDLLQKKEAEVIVTLSSELSKYSSVFNMRVISDLELGIFLSAKHPLSQRETLEIKDLQNETFYVFSDKYSNDAMEMIVAHCKREGFVPKNIKYFHNTDGMEVALHTGKGVSIAYHIFFRNKDNQLKFYPVTGSFQQHLVAAWRKDEGKELDSLIDSIAQQ